MLERVCVQCHNPDKLKGELLLTTPEGVQKGGETGPVVKAGKPDDSYTGKVCELDDATPYGRQLLYGGAALLFQSKAKGTQSSPRTLTSWVVNLDQPLRSAMKLEAGYPTETTFAKLKTTFPKGKLSKMALGESAVWIFTTPSGLWYRGDDNKTPTDVGAGSMGTCE